jgi:hypothetical protein
MENMLLYPYEPPRYLFCRFNDLSLPSEFRTYSRLEQYGLGSGFWVVYDASLYQLGSAELVFPLTLKGELVLPHQFIQIVISSAKDACGLVLPQERVPDLAYLIC